MSEALPLFARVCAYAFGITVGVGLGAIVVVLCAWWADVIRKDDEPDA